mmetsp:Transcript_4087/g.5140  ORF Transcript_4087/g.5140 Transcript_4087/m.5140 type:complete len:93 (+) Transcript_4087:354-632(+)
MGNQSVKSQDLIGESKEEEGFIGEDTIQYGYILAKGRRPYMEDFIKCQINYPERLVPHLGFFAVFDGHGGSRVRTIDIRLQISSTDKNICQC